MSVAEDKDLLERVLARDEKAWVEFVRQYDGLVKKACFRVAGEYEVDDATSEAYAALLANDMRKLRSWDRTSTKLSSWVFLLARNAAADYVRRLGRQPITVPLEFAEPVATVQEDIEGDVALMRRLFATELPRLQRRVAEMLCDDIPTEVIASRLRINIKTVYSSKFKLTQRLKELVQE